MPVGTRRAPRATRVRGSATARVEERVAALRREGRTLFRLGLGEPDFAVPQHVVEAVTRAVRDGRHAGYTDTAGGWALREVIAQRAGEDLGQAVTPEEVIVTAGGKQAIAQALAVICAAADEVLVPLPYWVSFPEQVRLAGARPRFLRPSRTQLKVTAEAVEAAIGPRTRVLILNSPNNPSGAVYSGPELEAIAAVCLRHDLIVLSDEVYREFVYPPAAHVSIASVPGMRERTVVVDSASKSWAMPGWRIGYAVARADIVRAMATLQSHLTSNASSVAQAALGAALAGPRDSLAAHRDEYSERAAWLARRVARIPGIAIEEPIAGGFFAWADIGAGLRGGVAGTHPRDADGLADVALEQMGVVLTPGTGFGSRRHVRLSIAAPREELAEGVERLAALLGDRG